VSPSLPSMSSVGCSLKGIHQSLCFV
jgi:hypothetical protein